MVLGENSNAPVFAYVGTYTTENYKRNRNAHGVGIYVYEIDPSGEWIPVQQIETLNPAVLAFGRENRYLYCVNTNSSAVSAYERDPKNGMLTLLNSAETRGTNVMVLSVDSKGEFLIAADRNGLVSSFHLNEDGSIGREADSLLLPGEKGPLHDKIQPCSRPHHVPFSPGDRFVLIPDKGLDLVHSYQINQTTGKLSPAEAMKCRPASCPRHIWFHPNGEWAYVNTEFTSTIISCRFDSESGVLTPFQIVPSLPEDFVGVKNMTSEIVVHPSGAYLYISNRGHETIGVFSIYPQSGKIAPVEWVDCGGRKPRFFALDPSGNYLYCGNQSSDTITVFRVDSETGKLTRTQQTIHTPTPVWILFTGPVLSEIM